MGDVAPPIPRGKGTGCQQVADQLPALLLEQGRELMREAGEPTECGIFDFYKVFSRAFGKGKKRYLLYKERRGTIAILLKEKDVHIRSPIESIYSIEFQRNL